MTGIETAALLGMLGTAATSATAAASTIGTTALAAAPWLSAGSAALGAVGAIRAGNDAKAAADFEAKQMKTAGDAAFAEGQNRAAQARRQTDLALGSLRAKGSASGAGMDEGITEGIMEQGGYNEMVAFYEGQKSKTNFYNQASATKAGGKNAQTAAYFNAASQIGKGASSIYDVYAPRYPTP